MTTVVAAALSFAVSAAPAGHAAGPDVIATSGSDATWRVVSDILAGTGAYNVPANGQITADYTVPGDSYCNDVTYNQNGATGGNDANGNPKVAAPVGASGGQTGIDGSVTKTYPSSVFYTNPNVITSTAGGCVDIARLTGKSTNAADESYGYAIDHVGWATPSLEAPAYLTLAQLRGIWNCNYNDWGQVGGSPGPIQRVLPPFGGGTRRFFINNVLGVSTETASTAWSPPTTGTSAVDGTTQLTCPATVVGPEQSNGGALLTPATRLLNQQYIGLYDSGNWVFQSNGAGNPSIDIRGGVRPGGLVGVAPTGTFPPAYPVRWTGTAWRQNDAQILGANASGSHSVSGVNAAAQFATTLTAGSGTFVAGDVGKQVQGTGINDGTTITAVAADGSSATIAPGAKAAIAGGTLLIGWAAVSEKNPSVQNTSSIEFPGVRELVNAVNPSSPDYVQARALIGYDDTLSNGAVSALCNGSDAGIISSDGFIPLSGVAGAVNTSLVTCRKQ